MAEPQPVIDDDDPPMQHAAANQAEFTQLAVSIVAVVLVLVAIMTAFMGQWLSFGLAVIFGGCWLVSWLVKVALTYYMNSTK